MLTMTNINLLERQRMFLSDKQVIIDKLQQAQADVRQYEMAIGEINGVLKFINFEIDEENKKHSHEMMQGNGNMINNIPPSTEVDVVDV